MINIMEVSETNKMVEHENLDVRTITIGISLLDCIDSDLKKLNDNIYKKITTVAKDLVSAGNQIEQEFGIPIVNKKNFRYTNCTGWRGSLQDTGRFCNHRRYYGCSSQSSRSKPDWWIFCTGIQGNDKGR